MGEVRKRKRSPGRRRFDQSTLTVTLKWIGVILGGMVTSLYSFDWGTKANDPVKAAMEKKMQAEAAVKEQQTRDDLKAALERLEKLERKK